MKTSSMISTRVAILSAGLLVSALSAVAQVNPFSPEININPGTNPPKSAALFLNGANADTGLTIGYGYDPYIGTDIASFAIDLPTGGAGVWLWRSTIGNSPETTPMYLDTYGFLQLQNANAMLDSPYAYVSFDAISGTISARDASGWKGFDISATGSWMSLYGVNPNGQIILDAEQGSIKIGGHPVLTQSASGLNVAANGWLGVGTTNPQSLLHVNGSGLFGSNTTAGTTSPINVSLGGTFGTSTPGDRANLKLDMYNGGGTDRYGIGVSPGLMEFQAGAGGHAFFVNNGQEAMRIASNGYVGIGTNNPVTPVHVFGTNNQVRVGYDATNYMLQLVGSTGNAVIGTAGTNPVLSLESPVVTMSGRVAINSYPWPGFQLISEGRFGKGIGNQAGQLNRVYYNPESAENEFTVAGQANAVIKSGASPMNAWYPQLFGSTHSVVNQGIGHITGMVAGTFDIMNDAAVAIDTGVLVRVSSPRIGNYGTFATVKGVEIQPQQVAGVTTGYGIFQEGLADQNYFGAATNRFKGKVLVPEQGDLSMGDFQNGPQP